VASILHFFSNYNSLGGVESVLRVHACEDRNAGIDSALVIACERTPEPDSPSSIPVRGLGIRGWHRITHLRKRFVESLATFSPHTIVFHNAWACRHLVDLIGSRRCVILIHTDSAVSRRAIQKCAHFSDGIFCVSKPISDYAKTLVSPDRVKTLDYPISPPPFAPRPPCTKPFVIGYAGRLVLEQKKVDRLIPLLKAFKSSGIRFRFEIMGQGPCEKMLRTELPSLTEVHFHGRLGGNNYWNTLKSWDFIVFVSDYEGTPISLLEAMSQGVIPIFPRIQSGGDELVKSVEPRLIYSPENYGEANDSFRFGANMLSAAPDFRDKMATAVASHRPDHYLRKFRENLDSLPTALIPKPGPSELSGLLFSHVPFAVIRRISADTIY